MSADANHKNDNKDFSKNEGAQFGVAKRADKSVRDPAEKRDAAAIPNSSPRRDDYDKSEVSEDESDENVDSKRAMDPPRHQSAQQDRNVDSPRSQGV